MKQALVMIAFSVPIGLLAAASSTRVLRTLLFGTEPLDPAVFAGATLALVGVMLCAAWLPARRAARVSPQVALRDE